MSYQLSKRVAADLFEEEYIIANLDTGLYYSLQGSGIYLLKNLPFNDPTKVIECLGETFPDKKEFFIQEMNKVWSDCLAEGIVVESTESQDEANIEVPAEYEATIFSRYEDMQDLLALDPIHEVGEEGWEKKENNES